MGMAIGAMAVDMVGIADMIMDMDMGAIAGMDMARATDIAGNFEKAI